MVFIQNDIAMLKDEIINIRRKIHQNPEKGFEEYSTSKLVQDKLKEYGIEHIDIVSKTGIVGVLKGSIGEKTTAFRADMDGLPVEEENDIDYKSVQKGMMHACGHDGHVAALLGFAKYAAENRHKIKDNLVFIFQPAEEGPGGAMAMIDEGIIQKYKIDRIIGMHIFPEFLQGNVASRAGALMARNGELYITVKGTKAHGAIPNKGADAIIAAASLIMAFQTIISRNISPMDGAVLTIGKIAGGDAPNVIADKVELTGTIRAFSDEVYDKLVNRILEIADGIQNAYESSINIEFNHMYMVVDNDKSLVKALEKAAGKDYIKSNQYMISEDFSFFQKEIPGLFFFMGSYNEEKGFIYPLHSAKFNFDEDILIHAVQIYANLLNEL
ncbi:MAG: amidohydrolase [Clostridiales bacterium]|nr:amidohydrolase [Clostridiales bacterium]